MGAREENSEQAAPSLIHGEKQQRGGSGCGEVRVGIQNCTRGTQVPGARATALQGAQWGHAGWEGSGYGQTLGTRHTEAAQVAVTVKSAAAPVTRCCPAPALLPRVPVRRTPDAAAASTLSSGTTSRALPPAVPRAGSPHSGQNLAPSGTSEPQAEHTGGPAGFFRSVPHSGQTLAAPASAPHAGQYIR